MSVRPISYSNGIYTVVCDEGGHTGEVAESNIRFIQGPFTPADHKFLSIECPDLNCNVVSTHPVGGGAAPVDVQSMFVNKIAAAGCACGNIESGNETLADAHAHLNCARMDGDERWQI